MMEMIPLLYLRLGSDSLHITKKTKQWLGSGSDSRSRLGQHLVMALSDEDHGIGKAQPIINRAIYKAERD
jgi:hypothetical protein